MMMKTGALTADFVYLRWLGDRYKIEEQTKRWDRIIIDRSREMEHWIHAIRRMLVQERTVYGYFNNHYAGYAVGSIRHFRDLWSQESPS
jgi:uncharacterized protein YecE (DUF72 family)